MNLFAVRGAPSNSFQLWSAPSVVAAIVGVPYGEAGEALQRAQNISGPVGDVSPLFIQRTLETFGFEVKRHYLGSDKPTLGSFLNTERRGRYKQAAYVLRLGLTDPVYVAICGDQAVAGVADMLVPTDVADISGRNSRVTAILSVHEGETQAAVNQKIAA